MESISIPIMESFPLVSIIMPYYGYCHEMFKILSELSASIRINLADYYPEFRRFMLKYAKVLENIKIKELSETKLPLDLFKFKIDEYSLSNGITDLMVLIDTLNLLVFFFY